VVKAVEDDAEVVYVELETLSTLLHHYSFRSACLPIPTLYPLTMSWTTLLALLT